MNREEKEQWLYETYQYTKNFDFNKLDKYEEANDYILIDDIILDYTMLYELYREELDFERKSKNLFIDNLYKVCDISLKQQQEIERLNNIINELEKYILDFKEDYEENDFQRNAKVYIYWKDLIDKLQELKDSDNE